MMSHLRTEIDPRAAPILEHRSVDLEMEGSFAVQRGE
jgi:hypothetical protein